MEIVINIQTILFKSFISLKEKRYKSGDGVLKYLFLNRGSKDLVIVFSGFPADNKPRYNYVKTLYKFKQLDSLFILDDFGYKGSYYLYEQGHNTPRELVEGLIRQILSNKGYERVYMLGSSKGGTCAIYYGLQFNATAVFAGANQYYIGRYLNVPERYNVFKAMIGGAANEKEWEEKLDSCMPNQLMKFKGSKCLINLLYSKDEHTYDDDIKWMIQDLEKNQIPYTEKIETFKDHGEVGYFFIPWIKQQLKSLVDTNNMAHQKGSSDVR